MDNMNTTSFDFLAVILNTIATVISLCVVVLMIIIIRKTKLLRRSITFVCLGFGVAVFLHLFTDSLELYGYLDANVPMKIMPIFISIGSVLIFIGCYNLLKITRPINELTEKVKSISTGKMDIELSELDRKDELGELARAFNRILVSLKLAMREQTTAGSEINEKTIDTKKIG